MFFLKWKMVKYISISVTFTKEIWKFGRKFLVINNLREKCEVYRPLPLSASVRQHSLIRIEMFFYK